MTAPIFAAVAPAAAPPYDLAPLLPVLAVGALLSLAAVLWLRWRRRGTRPGGWVQALTVLTLFLTFDLVLFGAYTRLTDSGLGCPDWPGCYGTSSPVAAHAHIEAALIAQPGGPVSHGKAWIEMVHRYLATAVGGLIALLTASSWLAWRRDRLAARVESGLRAVEPPGMTTREPATPSSPWWPTATLAWVCLQGAFGAWTVTMKLYPAIVTAHLLGGYGLLVLLALQGDRPASRTLPMARTLFAAVLGVAGLAVLQAALGGWVSTNYAVLACPDFPTCQGSFWPVMDFGNGFTLRRELGVAQSGGFLPFAALTAIQVVHRAGAGMLIFVMALLAWRLRATGEPRLRRWALLVLAIAACQVSTGVANVVLGWPLAAALAHTGGAAVLITLLALLASRARMVGSGAAVPRREALAYRRTTAPGWRVAP